MLAWDNDRWELVDMPGPLPGAGACEVNPRASNTGVQNTIFPLKAGFPLPGGLVLDWLELTIPTDTTVEQQRALAMLGATFPLQSTPYGGNGYTAGASFLGSGRVLWHPERPEMGVHVRMPAKNLASVAELIAGWSDPVVILRTLVEAWGAKLTCIDLALDTDTDVVRPAAAALEAGQYTSRAKKWRLIKGSDGGQTAEVGSRSSETFVRIYDKAVEQRLEGVTWSRVEFRYRSDRAEAVGALLLAGDYEALRSLMYGHLDFKQAVSDSNKTRWPTAQWWLSVLGTLAKRSLSLPAALKPTIEQICDWLQRQAGPSLALVWVHLEKQGVDFNSWVMSQSARWGPKHKLVLSTI